VIGNDTMSAICFKCSSEKPVEETDLTKMTQFIIVEAE
jgi:hypothetical protein